MRRAELLELRSPAAELHPGCARELFPRNVDVVDEGPGDDRIGLERPRSVRGLLTTEQLELGTVCRREFDELLGICPAARRPRTSIANARMSAIRVVLTPTQRIPRTSTLASLPYRSLRSLSAGRVPRPAGGGVPSVAVRVGAFEPPPTSAAPIQSPGTRPASSRAGPRGRV
jgi:hypothetical protein